MPELEVAAASAGDAGPLPPSIVKREVALKAWEAQLTARKDRPSRFSQAFIRALEAVEAGDIYVTSDGGFRMKRDADLPEEVIACVSQNPDLFKLILSQTAALKAAKLVLTAVPSGEGWQVLGAAAQCASKAGHEAGEPSANFPAQLDPLKDEEAS